MKAWRTTGISPEALTAFVALTSCCAAIFALNPAPIDDRYLDVLNGAIACLVTGLVAYRFTLETGSGMARMGWLIAGLALALLAVSQFFEGPFEAMEHALHLEDEDDIALMLVLPAAILVAVRSGGFGRTAMLFLMAAVAAQIVSTGIDLFDDPLARTEALTEGGTEVLIDVSEFVFLQLYLIGIAISALPKPAAAEVGSRRPRRREAGRGEAEGSWFKRVRLSLKKFNRWYIAPVVWRLRNPGGTPEDYYASMISRRITHGGFHPAIGPTARANRVLSELLDVLLDHGLKPSDTVVDYGCGSFRLGRSVIEYLEPSKYWGLDVTQDFLTMGMELLDPQLVAEKRPHALVIDEANLATTRAAAPDFVISWHVCSKVPPKRLPDYFGKIISLMGPKTQALVHFPETEQRKRQSRFSWAERRDVIATVIHDIDPSLELHFSPVTDRIEQGVRQTMVLMRRPG